MQRVSVIGGGRLGICASLLMESKGISVMVMDTNKSYLEQLHFRTHKTPEPQVEELLKNARQIEFTASLTMALEFSSLWMCFVPTPSLSTGEYDHSYIEQVIQGVYTYVDNGGSVEGKTLAICCTVMPTYCQTLQNRVREMGLTIVYNPEFIRQYSIVEDLKNADVVLIGSEREVVLDDLFEVYRKIMTMPPNFKLLSLTGAEIAKIGVNCYLTTKISYANYIGQIAINSGIENEVDDVLEMIGSDSRIGKKFFNYGFGYGGVCLIRDGKALGIHADKVGVGSHIPRTIDGFNSEHLVYLRNYWVNKNLNGELPFIFNQLSYKKGSNILTESQPYELFKFLVTDGFKVVVNETEIIHEVVRKEMEDYLHLITFGNTEIKGIEIN